jgi:hypothetical protein
LDLRLLAELNPIRQFRQYSHNKKGTLLLCSSCCIKSNLLPFWVSQALQQEGSELSVFGEILKSFSNRDDCRC